MSVRLEKKPQEKQTREPLAMIHTWIVKFIDVEIQWW